MELSGHQGLNLLSCRGGHICKAVDHCIGQSTEGILCSIGTLNSLRSLPNNKCKFESKFVIVIKLEDEVWILSRGGWFRVLEVLSAFAQ